MAQEMTIDKKVHPLAVLSLVLGILGLTVLPFIGSLGAIVAGLLAERLVADNPAFKGANLAQAGKVLGNIGVGLVFVGVALFIVGILLANPSPAGVLLLNMV